LKYFFYKLSKKIDILEKMIDEKYQERPSLEKLYQIARP